jgi:hypothetical protein
LRPCAKRTQIFVVSVKRKGPFGLSGGNDCRGIEDCNLSDSHQHDSAPRTIDQLKQEIDALFEMQHEALKRATYLGMTPDEAKTIEERRKKITALVDQLAKLKASE